MPTDDALPQQSGTASSLAQSRQTSQQDRPGVGDQGEQESAAAGPSQCPGGHLKVSGGEVVALEIDAGKTIHLKIDQAGCEPSQRSGPGRAGFDARDDAGLVMDQDRFAGAVVSAVQDARDHRGNN
jgi:hypothetical protein